MMMVGREEEEEEEGEIAENIVAANEQGCGMDGWMDGWMYVRTDVERQVRDVSSRLSTGLPSVSQAFFRTDDAYRRAERLLCSSGAERRTSERRRLHLLSANVTETLLSRCLAPRRRRRRRLRSEAAPGARGTRGAPGVRSARVLAALSSAGRISHLVVETERQRDGERESCLAPTQKQTRGGTRLVF